MSDLEIDLSLAKIITEKGAAFDSFYIRNADFTKITSRQQQAEIERLLRKALEEI
ncbi:MAG: hypothetical protein SFY81_13750 [Verrucomicrobiota bacterium]|nr:hypothetical protein [Verrucomicrobiota bacterium]